MYIGKFYIDDILTKRVAEGKGGGFDVHGEVFHR